MRADINIYCEDCLPVMKKMADNQYDLAIVDPPYGIGITNTENIGFGQSYDHRNGKKINAIRRKWEIKEWDNNCPNIEYFNELFRVSKNQIIWGINYFTKIINFASGRIIWEKNPSLKRRYEIAGISNKKNVVLFKYFWDGVLQGKSMNEGYLRQGNIKKYEKRIHPTHKPVALYKWLLKNYAKEGDKILDTHGGSMSIAIACWDAGYDLDLYEIDRDYYKAGKKRFETHKAQLQLY